MSADPSAAHRMDGAIAVVTGAAQGLGLDMAEQLARQGAENQYFPQAFRGCWLAGWPAGWSNF